MIELPLRVAAPEVDHVDALVSGTRLGEFEILGLIGVGGFGMVYRAYDHSLHRDVAIKEYMPTALARRADDVLNISIRTSADQATFQLGLQSFVGEARMLAKFEHPSLVRVFRFWEANGTAYMVMPFYRGMTLKQARKRMQTPPNEAWLRKVLWSVLGALKVLHRGHALHRDVSPDNIFLQDVGPPVLLDLGAARVAISDNSRQHTAILKVNFAPIEQYADVQNLPQGPWTDLYSLAAVVHCMLCNEAPMPATIRSINDGMPSFVGIAKTVETQFGLTYSEGFVNAIAAALAIHPEDRPQSVQEFARALGLVTPNGMSSFDWRIELGPACLPPDELLQKQTLTQSASEDGGASYLPTQVISSPLDDSSHGDEIDDAVTVVMPRDSDGQRQEKINKLSEPQQRLRERAAGLRQAHNDRMLLSTAPAALSDPMLSSAAVDRRSNIAWLIVGSVLVAGLAIAAWSWRGHPDETVPASVPVSGAIVESTAVTPTPAPSAPVVADLPAVAPATSATAPALPEKPQASLAPTTPSPASSPVKSAESTANKSAKLVTPAKRHNAPATAASKTETPRTTAVAEPAPTPAVPEPAPKAEVKPTAPAISAEKLCADKGFFARPMCIYKACQRPELVNTPTCIENEQRLKRNDQNAAR